MPTFGAVTKVNVYFVGVLVALLLLMTYVPAVPMSLVEWCYPNRTIN